MTRWVCATLLCVFLFPGSGPLWAGDAKAGHAPASTCAACHGDKGISAMAESPHLAGQQEQYLINALKSYRDGSRDDAIMASVTKSLSDEEIENLAAYFSSLDCK